MTKNKKTIDDVYALAGKSCRKVLDAYFPNQQKELIDWFYKPNLSLGCSPAEYCIKGNQNQLESILIVAAQGNI